jgi:CxxC motif-containing protein (DUF1111 family)
MRYFLISSSLFLLAVFSCKKDDKTPVANPDTSELYTGGTLATTFDFGENAFGVQAKGMTAAQDGDFVVGNSLFRSNWVTAPASVQTLDGLGPIFNAISCGSCHFKDGRAKPPESAAEPLRGLLFRLSIPGMGTNGEPVDDPVYGGQFQEKSILNVAHEGNVVVQYEAITGQYDDGSSYTLRQPNYSFQNLNYGNFSPGLMYSPRIAQQLPGIGLLEMVPEADILAFSDEQDNNGDGISGRANLVWDIAAQNSTLGRFGWKAGQPSLKQQAAAAFNGDIGITSNLFPQDHLSPTQLQQHPNVPNGGTPELPDEFLQKVVTYLQALSVPARRDYNAPDVLRGKFIFSEIKCTACHQPQLKTGNGGGITALQGQKIWPYTDLLLHDMGAGLADGRPDFLASGLEWRTPPLWGIGLVPVVNGHSYLLHDGRARNVEEAILWHGGEAEKSKEAFKKLSKTDRNALILFVNSL